MQYFPLMLLYIIGFGTFNEKKRIIAIMSLAPMYWKFIS